MDQFRGVFSSAILVFFLLGGTISFDPSLVDEIDMFNAVGLLNKRFDGVTPTTGQHANSQAFEFTQQTKDLIANQKAYDEANRLIHESHDFSIFAWAKIASNPNAIYRNTILSISSKKGDELYLLVMIEGHVRGTGLKVTVSVQNEDKSRKTHKGDTDRWFNYNQWHKISVRFQDSESLIRIFVDDEMVLVESFEGFDIFPDGAQLRLAQVYEIDVENTGAIKGRFTGDLQDVKFIRGTSLDDCPSPNTCKCNDLVGKRNCVMNGLRYDDGQRWKKDKCTTCDCKSGQVICTHTCPVCNDNGTIYLHGETWKQATNSCVDCRCEEGKSVCSPHFCPLTDCTGKSGELVVPEGKCCKVCKEDQCAGTGKVYNKCGCQRTCGNFECKACSEGCFCPEGKVLNDHGQCVDPNACTCAYNGKIYKPGTQIGGGCNICWCLLGKMKCMNLCNFG